MRRLTHACVLLVLIVFFAAGCGSRPPQVEQPQPQIVVSIPVTFSEAGDQAGTTLLSVFYGGDGTWRICNALDCSRSNQDWGADAATNALFLRWSATHDPSFVPIFNQLIATAPRYDAPCIALPCASWSDVPMWDAIALLRDYEVTKNRNALTKAEAAFANVDGARVFTLGACPRIRYQIAGGRAGYMLKTLETDANYVKAALLLYAATDRREYLRKAIGQYAAVRRYFLDPSVPLYSVYVYDDGKRCSQLPHRFFSSVNGDMIWSGLELAKLTGRTQYRDEAIATGRAIDAKMSDPAGVFVNMQAENDVAEPLVEAMYDLAAAEHQSFAFLWIVRNASAAVLARAPDGSFGRFWDGPPPSGLVSMWQSNGGLALEIVAAAMLADARLVRSPQWTKKRFVARPSAALPSTISFTGNGIAVIGTIGKHCCQDGHARVFVDGVETFDRSGIWQNKSMTGSMPNSILFAYRWPANGHHVVRFEPGIPNAKEGGPFLEYEGYLIDAY